LVESYFSDTALDIILAGPTRRHRVTVPAEADVQHVVGGQFSSGGRCCLTATTGSFATIGTFQQAQLAQLLPSERTSADPVPSDVVQHEPSMRTAALHCRRTLCAFYEQRKSSFNGMIHTKTISIVFCVFSGKRVYEAFSVGAVRVDVRLPIHYPLLASIPKIFVHSHKHDPLPPPARRTRGGDRLVNMRTLHDLLDSSMVMNLALIHCPATTSIA
ncbi:hypothetical protein COOONC_19872, partial [Cooperia oncophora]